MAIFGLGGLTLVFGYAVFKYGGVIPADWYPCLAVLGVVGAIYWMASGKRELAPPSSLLLRGLLAALLATCVLHILPLPAGLVRLLSPASGELHEALAPVLGPSSYTTLGIVPAETLRLVLTMAGYVVVFFLAREMCWRWEKRPWLVVAPFVAVAVLEGVLGLVQHYWALAPLARGTYVNRNHYAGLLEMALPFAVMHGVAVFRRSERRRETPAAPALKACASLALATVILLGIMNSQSRMGFIAALGALFVMGTLALGTGSGTLRRKLPVGALAVVVVLGFIFLPADPLIVRFADLAATEDLSADTRAQIWQDTVGLIADFPVFGCGLGGYESGLARYKTAAPMNTVDFAHNDYLQLLAELGTVGFGILLVLMLWMVRNALRGSSAAAGSNKRYLGIACAGALTAILLHSLVDFNLYIPANAMLLVWIAGVSEGLEFVSDPGAAWRGRMPRYPDAGGAVAD